MGDEGGEGIAEVLYRHIGEGIYLHPGGKSGHDGGAEAVHQPLDHQDAKVHHRLLDTGEDGEAGDLLHRGPFQGKPPPDTLQLGNFGHGVEGDTHAGDILGDDRGLRRPGSPPAEDQHEKEIQGDVQKGGYPQKHQGHEGVAQRAEKSGEVIVEEGGGDAAEDDL